MSLRRGTAPLACLIVVTVLSGCLTAPLAPRQEALSVITVNGTGRNSVKPDVALVNVGVEARAPALVDATAGVQLGALFSIHEGIAAHPVVVRSAAMAVAPSGPGPVEAGQLEIVVSVEARYRIAPR